MSVRFTAFFTLLWLTGLGKICGENPFLPDSSYPKTIPGYKIVWHDEFNYSGRPDTTYWSHEKGFVRNEELQWYQPENARCRRGVLTIEGRREMVPNPAFNAESNNWKLNRKEAQYTASSIHTRGKASWKFGRFEIRARIPVSGGAWPAIWTLGDNYEWPSCGEVDLLEYYLKDETPTILANVASGTRQRFTAKWNSQTKPLSYFTAKDPQWLAKFHIWRMDWDEQTIRLYLDDELLNETHLSETRNADGTQPFHQNQYLLLNLAIGGNGGKPDHNAFPLKYEIDYARVYQKENPTAREKAEIRPGEIFPDKNGVHINAHGGGMLYRRGTYYWYGEHKCDSSNNALVGVNCYTSTDLMNWKYSGVALAVSTRKGSDIESGCIIERPKVVYNAKTKTYVMWFHLELKGKGYEAARVGLAVSKTATGPFRFVRSYRPCANNLPLNMSREERNDTTDIQKLKPWSAEWLEAIRKGAFAKRDLKTGQMSRDMTIFVDDNQKAYHIYASEDNLTIQIAELTTNYQAHTGRFIRLAPAGHNEAPTIFKRKGTYWMITSGCTGWAPNEARMFSAKSIWGPWTKHPNPCVGPEAETTFRSQGTYIQRVEGKPDLFLFMADRWKPKRPIDGRYVWLPVGFDQEGKPILEWKPGWSLPDIK